MPEYVSKGGKGTALQERTKARDKDKQERPRKYRVVLLNDNYTTMEFVISVLEQIFRRPTREAARIMMSVHKKGRGTAGVYVKAIAEAKAETVHQLARDHGYPLKCQVEPDGGDNDDDGGQ